MFLNAKKFFLVVIPFLFPLLAYGAPPNLRPLAGKGVVIVPAVTPHDETIVYDSPGVRRKGSSELARLPALSSSVSRKGGETVLAAFALREGYVLVAVSASGEDGWLELRPEWRFVTWERYLAGRTVRLMTGLRETASRLRQTPAESGATVGAVSATAPPLTVSEVRDDWALVHGRETVTGWLRWRDGDGRLLVTVK